MKNGERNLLIRIDERVLTIKEDLKELKKGNSIAHKEFYDRIRNLEKRPIGSFGAIFQSFSKLIKFFVKLLR